MDLTAALSCIRMATALTVDNFIQYELGLLKHLPFNVATTIPVTERAVKGLTHG